MSETTKASFLDRHGKEWTICLDVPLIRRVKEVTGVGLTDLRSDPWLRMAADPILLVDVLWLLCEKQAKERQITDIQFGESLVGDQIDSATEAMQEAVVNFSPSARRSLLRSLIAENLETQQEVMTAALTDVKQNRARTVAALNRRTKAEIGKFLASIESANSSADESVTSSTDATPFPAVIDLRDRSTYPPVT